MLQSLGGVEFRRIFFQLVAGRYRIFEAAASTERITER
jgi:hypothetical protein